MATVQTNIVIFQVDPALQTAEEALLRLRKRGIFMGAAAPQAIRAVTHADVSRKDIDVALTALQEILR